MKKFNVIIGLIIFIIGCVPPSDLESGSGMSDVEIADRNRECDLFLSFATTNYQNRDYSGAVKNYLDVINLGCGERNARQIYQWMGRSYIELGKLDSASYIFKQGLKYLPNDPVLLEVAAWNEGKLGNTDNQIYYYEKILEMDESNTDVLSTLSDIYRDNERYQDQLNILNMWLKVDNTNKKAIGEKKAAYNALGKDESEVDKERWEKDPSNIVNGLEYVSSLLNNGSSEIAMDVLLELKSYDKYNKEILQNLGKIYLDLGDNESAMKIYEELFKLDKSNYSVAITISEILIDKEDYKTALDWAETGVKITGGNGVCLFQRAEVYFSAADACSGESLNFNDKLVYEMAYEDYEDAVKKGYYRAKVRRDFLKENSITTTGDWFMLGDEKVASPEGNCYNWINRSISKN